MNHTNDFPIKSLSSTNLNFIGWLLLGIILLTLLDITVDLIQGVEPVHLSVEAFIIPLAAAGLYKVWHKVSRLDEENVELRSDLVRISHAAEEWKKEATKYIAGLSEAIDQQLSKWELSPAEKEVALLLLKGLSHKEIAEIRKTSERTTRQQGLALYEKSGLRGRAELAAFFLEDLLTPRR